MRPDLLLPIESNSKKPTWPVRQIAGSGGKVALKFVHLKIREQNLEQMHKKIPKFGVTDPAATCSRHRCCRSLLLAGH
jgi:hypothetical protein